MSAISELLFRTLNIESETQGEHKTQHEQKEQNERVPQKEQKEQKEQSEQTRISIKSLKLDKAEQERIDRIEQEADILLRNAFAHYFGILGETSNWTQSQSFQSVLHNLISPRKKKIMHLPLHLLELS